MYKDGRRERQGKCVYSVHNCGPCWQLSCKFDTISKQKMNTGETNKRYQLRSNSLVPVTPAFSRPLRGSLCYPITDFKAAAIRLSILSQTLHSRSHGLKAPALPLNRETLADHLGSQRLFLYQQDGATGSHATCPISLFQQSSAGRQSVGYRVQIPDKVSVMCSSHSAQS